MQTGAVTLAGCFPKRPGASLTISSGIGGKTNSEEEFHEQMHCYGQSKVAVTFDIQFAKLPQLKVICSNCAQTQQAVVLEVNLNYLISAQQVSFMFRESYS